MYRIGELAKMAEVTPDTIRYYEKQQMMEHEVRTEGGFRLYTNSDLQRLKFIRHARQLGFSLESIRELLSKPTFGAYFMLHHLLLFVITNRVGCYFRHFCQLTNAIHTYSTSYR